MEHGALFISLKLVSIHNRNTSKSDSFKKENSKYIISEMCYSTLFKSHSHSPGAAVKNSFAEIEYELYNELLPLFLTHCNIP
jgi:hypothetical protein